MSDERVVELVASLGSGVEQQQSISWSREKWEPVWTVNPDLPGREALNAIDSEVARHRTIRREWIRSTSKTQGDTEDGRLLLLVLSTIWGYGDFVGRGRKALTAMLSTPGCAETMADIVNESRESARRGFSALFENGKTRINWLGIAFGTKAIHFAGYDFAAVRPLVLDARVYRGTVRLGVEGKAPDPSKYTTGDEYEAYCRWAADVARRCPGEV